MKILHTADWHIGQQFYEYDRSYEHEQFLNWLLKLINSQQIDVLLISGDIFDHSNPSSNSIKLFYTFLSKVIAQNPDLYIIVTAGNHDSAARLETPKPLLESSRISIIGNIAKDETGKPDYSKLLVPLIDANEELKAYCLAVPFLRQGDIPIIQDSSNPYIDGIVEFYHQAYTYTKSINEHSVPIIAMGHLHATSAELTELDQHERIIMGGVESVPISAFHPEIAYVALGHIHKAQRIGGNEVIRYSGSPIPLSFSELNYSHQVITFQLNPSGVSDIQSIEVPISVPLIRIPPKHEPLDIVLTHLNNLPIANDFNHLAPYLEVRVLLDKPEPSLRQLIENALKGKQARLTRIEVSNSISRTSHLKSTEEIHRNLNDIQPVDLFKKTFEKTFQNETPKELLDLFNESVQTIQQREEI